MRKRFSELFVDLLKTQLILKGICSIEEWEEMKEHIQFDYIADNYFTELKEIEIRNERMNQVAQMDPYVGKYFSVEYIRTKVLKQTESEIKEIDKEIKQEIADGVIMDPQAMAAMEMGIGLKNLYLKVVKPLPTDPSSAVSPADQKRGELNSINT